MENIDPVEYGKLLGKVDALSAKVESMDSDIKELLALANKSKGGFWMGMAMASTVSGFVAWFVTIWNR
jgi:hypothetical protein